MICSTYYGLAHSYEGGELSDLIISQQQSKTTITNQKHLLTCIGFLFTTMKKLRFYEYGGNTR